MEYHFYISRLPHDQGPRTGGVGPPLESGIYIVIIFKKIFSYFLGPPWIKIVPSPLANGHTIFPYVNLQAVPKASEPIFRNMQAKIGHKCMHASITSDVSPFWE